jgi:hypothetical protein
MAKGGRQVAGNRGDLDNSGLLMEASLSSVPHSAASILLGAFGRLLSIFIALSLLNTGVASTVFGARSA